MSSYPSPATTKNRTIERITLLGTAYIKIVYAYVHWVLIQAVPFAFFISILRFCLVTVCLVFYKPRYLAKHCVKALLFLRHVLHIH